MNCLYVVVGLIDVGCVDEVCIFFGEFVVWGFVVFFVVGFVLFGDFFFYLFFGVKGVEVVECGVELWVVEEI